MELRQVAFRSKSKFWPEVMFWPMVGALQKPPMGHAGNWGLNRNERGMKRNRAYSGLQAVSCDRHNEV